jgi:hypothetical protein
MNSQLRMVLEDNAGMVCLVVDFTSFKRPSVLHVHCTPEKKLIFFACDSLS